MYTYGDWREEGGGIPGRGSCMGKGLGMMRTVGSGAGDGTGDLACVILGTWSARLAGPDLLSGRDGGKTWVVLQPGQVGARWGLGAQGATPAG